VLAGVGLAESPAAQSAVNHFDTTTVVSGSGNAYCPSGYRVTGGGSTTKNNVYSSLSSDEYFVTGSYPASTTKWTVTGYRLHGTWTSNRGWTYTNATWYPSVKAVCTT
jgi:hypothetical protein